jgi:hypothetical protein
MDSRFGMRRTLFGNLPKRLQPLRVSDLRDHMYENSMGIAEEMSTELISSSLRFMKFSASRWRNNGFSMDKELGEYGKEEERSRDTKLVS